MKVPGVTQYCFDLSWWNAGALCAGLLAIGMEMPAAQEGASGEPIYGVLELGRTVFTEEAAPPCALCHTLAEAEAAGEIGPNLDRLADLTPERVELAIRSRLGVMPAYEGKLSDGQIKAVAVYVAEAAGD